MSTNPSKRQDLTDAPAAATAFAAAVRGDQLLSSQETDGFWGAGTSNPEWVTLQTLLLLRDMGLDPTSEQAREAVARVRDNVKWQGVLPQDAAWHGKPLFAGEVEPCINGWAVAVGESYPTAANAHR